MLCLAAFLPGVVPVEMFTHMIVQNNGVTISIALRQSEFEVPSIAEEVGDATARDIESAMRSIGLTASVAPLTRWPIDQLLDDVSW